MDADELAAWQAMNRQFIQYGGKSGFARPCVDCPVAWSKAMGDLCNGTPRDAGVELAYPVSAATRARMSQAARARWAKRSTRGTRLLPSEAVDSYDR